MKLETTVLLGLVVCFAVVNGVHHASPEYDGQYTPEPPTPKEEAGPVEEESGGHEAKPGEETGGEAGEENGGKGGEETGGEETGGEMAKKPPKEHPEGMMGGDTDAENHKGYCHWDIGVWMKPGVSRRCGCMRCMCKKGGIWDCNYHFAYCPYFYCGNLIYNPHTQLCCCGKAYDKKAHHSCCGYYYYDIRHNKCCNYYSVRGAKSHCPRDRV